MITRNWQMKVMALLLSLLLWLVLHYNNRPDRPVRPPRVKPAAGPAVPAALGTLP